MNGYHQSEYGGMSAFSPDQALKLAVDLVSFCTNNMPRWNTTDFFCYGIEEAGGGTAVEEIRLMLGFEVATTPGIGYEVNEARLEALTVRREIVSTGVAGQNRLR